MGYFKNFIVFRCSRCGRVMNGYGYVFENGEIFCSRCIICTNEYTRTLKGGTEDEYGNYYNSILH